MKVTASFTDYLAGYLTQKRSEGRHVDARRTVYSRFAGHFGNKPINKVQPADVKKYLDSMTRNGRLVSTATRTRHKAYLSSIFNEAIMDGLCASNPARAVRLPREKARNRIERYLTPDEYATLLAACPPALRALVQLATNTGMRLGELMGLQWSFLDSEQRILYLPDSLCKSGRGRTVDLNEKAWESIEYFRGLQDEPEGQIVMFPGSMGLTSVFPRYQWNQVVKALGWGPDCPNPRLKAFRFHTLRHTCASWLVQNGETLQTVRDVLGHASIRQTEVYSHLAPSHRRRALLNLTKGDV